MWTHGRIQTTVKQGLLLSFTPVLSVLVCGSACVCVPLCPVVVGMLACPFLSRMMLPIPNSIMSSEKQKRRLFVFNGFPGSFQCLLGESFSICSLLRLSPSTAGVPTTMTMATVGTDALGIMFEQSFQQQSHCGSTMCAFLPVGLFLMSMDIVYDLAWCLFPSDRTATALKGYYRAILTPRLFPPYPGWLFPVYATYVFLLQCPNIWNWCIFFLYVPVSYRYYQILTALDCSTTSTSRANKSGAPISGSVHTVSVENEALLRGWWSVVLLRVLLTITTLRNLQSRGCEWNQYFQDLLAALSHLTKTIR